MLHFVAVGHWAELGLSHTRLLHMRRILHKIEHTRRMPAVLHMGRWMPHPAAAAVHMGRFLVPHRMLHMQRSLHPMTSSAPLLPHIPHRLPARTATSFGYFVLRARSSSCMTRCRDRTSLHCICSLPLQHSRVHRMSRTPRYH